LFDIFRRKPIDLAADEQASGRLRPTLSAWQLVLLGVGAIVGTGIYTLVGVGAERAGPAVMLSFAVAGAICVFAALAYAELATMVPASGSAYTYAYVSMGEIIAWLVGWALILEYSVVCSAVAVGWSGYATGFLTGLGVELPKMLTAGPAGGGLVNLPAIVIIAAVTGMLLVGVRESANLNAALVVIKIAALAVFVALALPAFDLANFEPFSPYGFAATVDATGADRGVMSAAAIIFFAFYGFDAVSTAAEETKDPGRNLSIGIIGSMLVCTLIYMTVAAAAVGAEPFQNFATSGEPLAHILRSLGHGEAAAAIAAAAVIALPTVILAFMFGQSRIFFVMARDGLFPRRFGAVDPKSGAPAAMTILTGVVCSAIAGVLPLATIAELANAGTLCAFIATAIALIILRVREPNRTRPFKAPFGPGVALLAIAGCLYLFASLPAATQTRFFLWMGLGLVAYFVFARRPAAKSA
jgi:APA family basic amino acid/polyamine antiporter